MEKIKTISPLIFLILVIFFTFRSWFLPGIITGGDWWPGYQSMLDNLPLYPYAWGAGEGIGLGGSRVSFLWFHTFAAFSTALFGRIFNGNVELVERFGFFYPFLLISIFSSVFLFRKLFPNSSFWFFSPLMYTLNTYILMVAGGGQMFIALSYSLAPLVLLYFAELINNLHAKQVDKLKIIIKNLKLWKQVFIAGLVLAIQVMLDIRIAYVSMIAVVIYAVLSIKYIKDKTSYTLYLILYTFVIPIGIASLLHAFWVLPTILSRANPIAQLGEAHSTTSAVKFFSFAFFENSFSLLHPNWPEDIFGKVYFMKPEFLALPILAYFSLLFLNSKRKSQNTNAPIGATKLQLKSQKLRDNVIMEQYNPENPPEADNGANNRTIIFFILLGLIGAFLAKGANPPFGEVYLWLFETIPGFNMFRDPTKFYILVALSYSVLIPFSVSSIYRWLNSKFKIQNLKLQFKTNNVIPYLYLILTTLYLILLIRPAILGQLGGTLKQSNIPEEYVQLEHFLSQQDHFFRTFWIPSLQRFGYWTPHHPAISASHFFNTSSASAILRKLSDGNTQNLLQQASVKYIIVPFDSEGEIFLKDRKYDQAQRIKIERELDKIPWLKKLKKLNDLNPPAEKAGRLTKISIYELSLSKDHFWLANNDNSDIIYKSINPSRHEVKVENAHAGDVLVFSEAFDTYWVAKLPDSSLIIPSSRYKDVFNSFILPKHGNYTLEIYYTPQKWVDIGVAISGITLLFILTLFMASKLSRHFTQKYSTT